MSVGGAKVPAVVAGSVIALLVGIGVGAAGMSALTPTARAPAAEGGAAGGRGGPGAPGGRGGGEAAPQEPGAKVRLMTLVDRLDLLTERPLFERLDKKQREKVAAQLKGLDALDEVDEEEARRRLDALIAALQDEGEPLARAGFRWPGQQAGIASAPLGLMAMAANPFKEGLSARQLKTLRQRLDEPAP
jgi:hypothetical protein